MPRSGIRIALIAAAIVGALLIAFTWWLMQEPDRITVVSWGDEYGRAQSTAMIRPYADDTGVEVREELYGGGIAELTRQVESGRIDWDVVDFELPDAAEACQKGLLEAIDPAALPAGDNGTPATADFVPGAIGKCWVGSVVYSQVIAYRPAKFTAAVPSRAEHFFDLLTYPGARGMKDAPKGNLELALLASGVPAAEVYRTLSTPEGVARAFAKLDTIQESIVWWSGADEPMTLLESDRVIMTTVLNGKVAEALRKPGHGMIGIVWDGQRYELDVFAIPRGTPNREHALDFIRFATGTKSLAHIAQLLPYGPARRSGVIRVGFITEPSAPSHTTAPVEQQMTNSAEAPRADTPTDHMENALYLDPDWWAMHGAVIDARWKEWRAR